MWYIGQEAIALQTHTHGYYVAGKEYIILNIKRCQCNQHFLLDIGHKAGPHYGICSHTNRIIDVFSANIVWFNEKAFAAPDQVKISEIHNLLNTLQNESR